MAACSGTVAATLSRPWSPQSALRAEQSQLASFDWERQRIAPVIDAFAEGYTEARRTVEAEVAAERVMLLQLIEAVTDIEPSDPEPLATLLTETVMRLVRDVVGAAPVDAALLFERATKLVEAMGGDQDEPRLLVHPDLTDYLQSLACDVAIVGDPSLAPGDLRLTFSDGFADDGVSAALDRLQAALAQMELGE